MSTTMNSVESMPAPFPKKKYVKAVGPRLRILLLVVFALVALLGANSAYLVSITALEAWTQRTYQNYFYQIMFLGHLVLGLLLILPFVTFGIIHIKNTWTRKNRRAVRIGQALFIVSLLVLGSGVALMRVGGFNLRSPTGRVVVYWMHVITPLMAVWLYWLHRLAGPPIKWRMGLSYAGAVAAACLAMVLMHRTDPRKWNVAGPKEGEKYFFPSLARTSTGNFIPADTLMMDNYCLKCHQDNFNGWFHSAHHFSSFNNPAYLAAVRETRQFAMKHDQTVQRSRWCAGCHDQVPFFSGAFDDPNFDDVKHPTAQAGMTCTVCHAITNIQDTRGNANYTIEEPVHYPFAKSDKFILQWINNQMVKAKPSFHKKTFLKPLHKSAEFCSTCHKVHLPPELNNYKWLRGQNHYDTFLLSGVSGHGARSFYYPPKAQENCNGCHMPLKESADFGAKFFGTDKLSVHNHLFPAANTGLAHIRNQPQIVAAHQEFLKGVMRVDIFGLRENGAVDGKLVAPLRPTVPTLKPGQKYLLETVIRTVKMGHPFTQGTVDSNEVWMDVTVRSGDRIIGRSGALDKEREVDPWSHFVNVFMLDREGNRIARRNPQDIFVPLYNNQIPPGAAATVHYELQLPEKLSAPITIEAKLQYRKFDKQYMDFVTGTSKPGDNPIKNFTRGEKYLNDLPITTLAVDTVTLPVEGLAAAPANPPSQIPPWQRWNDYGIGLLLKGKAQFAQAVEAFSQVEKMNRFDGPLNLARVYFAEGRLDEAVEAIARAAKRAGTEADPPAPPWTMSWMSGLINRQQGHLEAAEKNFRSVVEEHTAAMAERGFDFSKDYEVINELGQTLFERAEREWSPDRKAERDLLLNQAAEQFKKTLALDPENVTAHYNLQLIYGKLGDATKAEEHAKLHARYKTDDNARDRALVAARKKYPAGNNAAEALVIYPLRRANATDLAGTEAKPSPSPSPGVPGEGERRAEAKRDSGGAK